MPTTLQAALLGAVQGLTEFLPVSSSAHLILARMFFGFDGDKFGLAFDVAIHIGTLVAVVVYFGEDLRAMTRSIPDLVRPGRAKTGEHVAIDRQDVRPGPEGARLIWLMAVATIPVVILSPFYSDAVEQQVRTPEIAAAGLAIGAIGLLAAERVGAKRRNEESLTVLEAFWIGWAQALAAVVPGISRSGATITVALVLGLRRAEAARFTFLLGIAAILGAAVFEFRDMLEHGLDGEGAVLFAAGTFTSAVVGYAAVKYFIRYLARHSLDVFAWYRLALAASVVIWIWQVRRAATF